MSNGRKIFHLSPIQCATPATPPVTFSLFALTLLLLFVFFSRIASPLLQSCFDKIGASTVSAAAAVAGSLAKEAEEGVAKEPE